MGMRHTYPALAFEQSGFKLYTAILDRNSFPKHVRTDPYTLDNEEGYQRLLNEDRAKVYGSYIEENPSPRSILLNVRGKLKIGGKGRRVTISVPDEVFNVDGQHFHKAISIRDALTIFEAPVIFANVSEEEEKLLFLVMNTTPEKIPTDIRQQVDARRKSLLDALPTTMSKRSEVEVPATQVTNLLFNDPSSIWFKKITLAGMRHDSSLRYMRQASFVASLAHYVFKCNKSLTPDKAVPIVNALWDGAKLAWGKCFDDPDMYALLGMMGVGVLHRLLGRIVLPRLLGTQWEADKTAYRDILLASGISAFDWASGNAKARIGSQLGTNRRVYDYALNLMKPQIEKNWPGYLPAFKVKKQQKKQKQFSTVDHTGKLVSAKSVKKNKVKVKAAVAGKARRA